MKQTYVYEKDYVENHLLAYIGNKRRLLPLLLRAIKEVETRGSKPIHKRSWFIDYFSGTGVVSRLAKSLGYKVISNDWEDYAYVMNKAFVESSQDIENLFHQDGGIHQMLEQMNKLVQYSKQKAYISDYYCPKNDAHPQKESERMFYTRKNGILIDNIRAAIQQQFPLNQGKRLAQKHYFLLSLLLAQASKRSNTSGVFKGFHKGFGGEKKDALGRIMQPVSLTSPVLSQQTNPCKVFRADALKLAPKLKQLKADIIYLDPPYNQHQYGSNYHLLNTIARDDKPPVQKNFWINGKKVHKSAIRKDWIKTKSTFCLQKKAEKDFQTLIDHVGSAATYLLISYSTEGIIDFDTMLHILSRKGRIGVVTSSYTRYRGGRQSNRTKCKNIEFILIVDTHQQCRPQDIANVKGILLQQSFWNVFQETFPIYQQNPSYLVLQKKKKGNFWIRFPKWNLSIPLNDHMQIDSSLLEQIASLPYKEQNQLLQLLQTVVSYPNSYEVRTLCTYLKEQPNCRCRNLFFERILRLYGKIHPQKDAKEFYKTTHVLRSFMQEVLLSKSETNKANNTITRLFGKSKQPQKLYKRKQKSPEIAA